MRLNGYDYSQDNLYFITICTNNRDKCFGRIIDREMELNEYGKIADEQFKWLQSQYSYIKISVWIIMPDHIHAIIQINADRVRSRPDPTMDPTMETIKIKPLPELIGAYKTTTSKRIHQSGMCNFLWQRSYYDHIIRNSTEYNRVYRYIENNPSNYNQKKISD